MAGDYDYFEKKRERKEDGVELKKKGRGGKEKRRKIRKKVGAQNERTASEVSSNFVQLNSGK